MRTAIIKVLEGVKLKGCYFQYIKCLWAKDKILGLTNKYILDKTIEILKFLFDIDSNDCEEDDSLGENDEYLIKEDHSFFNEDDN